MRTLAARLGALCVAVVVSSTGWTSVDASASTPVGADPFFSYDGSAPLASFAPGAVLKTRTMPYNLDGLQVPLQVTQLLYRTEDAQGRPAANVTSVLRTPVAARTDKLVAYGSFYDSLNPADSPSRAIAGGTNLGAQGSHGETALMLPFLLEGYSVVVADTEGQAADFAAGPEYGRTTLDSIRATWQASTATGVTPGSQVGLLGYSGGAIATNWAAALAPGYAPEVDAHLVGAAEGGVLVFPAHNLEYVDGSPVWAGIAAMALVGAARAYDIDFRPYLSDLGREVTARLATASIINVLGQYPGLTVSQLLAPQYSDPASIPAYVETVNRLNLGSAPTPTAPMFIGQASNGVLEGTPGPGQGDGVMVAGDVRSLARQYCETNHDVQYTQYDQTSHITTVPQWYADATAWLRARFAGAAAPSSCGTIAPGTSLAPLTASS